MDHLIAIAAESNVEGRDVIMGVLQRMLQVECLHCGGKGHVVATCSSKSSLDRTFRNMRLQASWGTIKSQIIVDYVDAAVETREERSNILRNRRIQKRNRRVGNAQARNDQEQARLQALQARAQGHVQMHPVNGDR